MKKRGRILKYLSMFLFAFGALFIFNVSKAYAAHGFDFKVYDCNSLDNAALSDTIDDEGWVLTQASAECTGPNNDGVVPELSTETVSGVGDVFKVEKGKVYKVAVHYTHSEPYNVAMQVKFYYDGALEPIKFHKFDENNQVWSDKLAYTYGDTFKQRYSYWVITTALSLLEDNKVTMNATDSRGSAGTRLRSTLDIVYYYFKVSDDAPSNTAMNLTFDRTVGTGIVMGDKSEYVATDAILYAETPLSDDNTLGSLSVSNGSTTYPLTPTFTPGDKTKKTFSTVVPRNITSVNINATANDAPKATVTGTGNKTNLNIGNNSFTLTVLSESGDPEEYTVNVYRLNNNANLSALSLSNVNFGTFAPGTTSYTATVPYTTSSTSVSATVADTGKATLASGSTGNKDLSVGANQIDVTVNAENCKSQYSSVPGNSCTSKTYTVTVTREEPSTISTLNDLLANNTRVKGFQPGDGTKTYTLDDVPYNTSTMTITYVKGEDHETVSGDLSKNLTVGNNTLNVVVTAQDGTTKTTYTIKVKRLSNNANLGTLTATGSKGGSLDKTFNANTTSYTFNATADETSVDISYTLAHAGATAVTTPANLTGINPRTTQSVTIQVTPEDTTQTKKTYTITFNVAKSTNNNLSDLTVDGDTIEGFSSGTTDYTYTVASNIESVNIGATREDDRSQLSGDLGVQTLNYGENTINVTVTPEDPNAQAKTYTITVTRTKKNISNLSDLKVDGTTVPGFKSTDPSGTHYTLDAVGYNKSSINITYTKGDADETVSGTGNQNISVGNNSKKVTVTAQNGTDKTEYYIDVYRKNNNANLSGLNVTSSKTGSLDKAFNANTTSYVYNTDADETSVNITYTKADEHATVVTNPANLTGINPRTTSSVTIEVTPEDTTQTKKTYTITFAVAKSTNGNLSEITVDNEPITGFTPDNKEYEITVPSTTESIIIGAELEDDRGEITGGTGVQTLDYGENEIEITVQPEDPNAEPVVYTITVTKEKENVSTLNDLLVDGTRVKGFTPGDGTKTYELDDVGYTKDGIEITYVKGESHETITGNGVKSLNVGVNEFPVEVTAHNGTDKTTYTIKIYRKNNNADLSGLTITSTKGGSLDKAFNANTTSYIYSTDADETSINISYTKADEHATASSIPANLTGINPRTTSSVTIEVTPEDTTQPKKTYTITFEVAQSTNPNISSITIDGEPIDGFSPNDTEYTITVPSDKDQIDIEAELEDGRGTISGDTGMQDLDYGDNTFTITGNAEDGTPKDYVITITREKEHDATLVEFKVDGEPVPGFSQTDPDGTEYEVEDRPNATESVNISVITNEEHATVSGTGDIPISIGDNRLPVTITAHDSTTTITYYVKVRRKDSDNTLKSLTITSDPAGTWDTPFDPGTKTYTYTVDRDEDEVVIDAEANGEKADVSGTGTYNPQNTESVQILVTPEDGQVEIYTINFVKAKSSNADLDSLAVEGYTIDPDFDADETEYSVTVPSTEDKVNIIAHAADRLAQIEGDGQRDVTYGSNRLEVKVTPEDPAAEPKTYVITVTRELSDSVKLSDLTVDGDTVEGFDPEVPAYDIGTVPNDKTQINIGATASGPVTSIEGTGTKDLVVGKQTFEIVITAQDGTTSGTYSITVEREASSDNTLSALEVVGYDLDKDFDPDETSYSVTVPSDVDSVTVNATPTDDNANATVTGNENLQPGENTVTVTVVAQDGTPKEYTITVTREEDDEKITSQVRKIEDGMVKDAVFKMTPDDLKDQCDNDNDKLFVYPDDESTTEVSSTSWLATGMYIKLIKNGRLNDKDAIVVKGEVTGDGDIKINDVVRVVAVVAEADTLDGIWFEAADYTSDGQIKINDVVAIVAIVASE